MKTLLVATDFSTAAADATRYATEMALAIKADIFLLHVYQLPAVYTEIPVALNVDEMMNDAKKELADLKKQISSNTGDKVSVETKVVMGEYFQELETLCENIQPYAVVIGRQGKTAAERFLFGGHTVYAMRHLMWPLITVPPGTKFSAIRRIALACDFENVSETVPIDEINTLVKDFNAELHIINIGKREDYNPEIVFQSGLLQRKLKALKPVHHFVSNENTDEAIPDFTEENRMDLLIVMPKRHQLFDAIRHKSHAKQLIMHSHVPVMVLHH